MTNKSQIDPEHLSFNSLRILRFCHLNMFKELHTKLIYLRSKSHLSAFHFSVSKSLLFLKAGANIERNFCCRQTFFEKYLKIFSALDFHFI